MSNTNCNIGIAQINPIAGDIEYNALKVLKYIKEAESKNLDLVIFPELILMGFPLEDTIGRYTVVAEENIKWLKELATTTRKTTAIVGFIEPINQRREIKYYNTVAILKDGEIKQIIRKSNISSYQEFNDYKYIEPSKEDTTDNFVEINGRKYGITIGEDCFSDNLIAELLKNKPEVIINCSATPCNRGKEQVINKRLSFLAKTYNTPIICVNQVGTIDSIPFEGSSKVFSSNGELSAKGKSFEEELLIVNPFDTTEILSQEKDDKVGFSLDYEPTLERTYKIILQGIRDYFRKNGFERAVLGLSGGLDSTVCAVLLADAIGKENVFGISMPSKITSDESRSDAEILANNLGIHFTEMPIKPMVETTTEVFNNLFGKVENKWNCRYKQSFTQDNIQARSRAMYLWGVSNEFCKCIPIATSDKSELYMGYATINGDMSGGIAPIADIPKTKLFALARWLNKNRPEKNAIPESIILKRPGAELAIDPKTGKPLCAEDALMPYEFLDEIIWRVENKQENYQDLMDSEFVYEKAHNISKEQKTEWLDKFYRRMSTALYKSSILPPAIIVEYPTINKSVYRQPITSSRINYKGLSIDEIREKLNESI